ncbi:MAG: glycosyltransferase [Paludibacteraceae bacterium]|nr:glycosyltransferase [Paludibacteraceae bacterium]
MNQLDATTIATESSLNTDAVIINQCDKNSQEDIPWNNHKIRFISSTERGLSRSRNKAIQNATADICMLSDDDEIFTPTYSELITTAYEDYPDADVILFQVANSGKTYSKKPFKVGYLQSLCFASWNITFRRQSIVENNLHFDEMMGSGTGNGSGEEICFLFDCLHAGLKLQYVPITIARIENKGESQWFHGFDALYFRNRGWATARYLGKMGALFYGLYFVIAKRNMFVHNISIIKAYNEIIKGIFEHREKDVLGKQNLD